MNAKSLFSLCSLCALLLGACSSSGTAPGSRISQKAVVQQVHSGDTLTLYNEATGSFKVKLYGVAAPDPGQAYAGAARSKLQELTRAKEAEYVVVERTAGSPAAVYIHVNGVMANTYMLQHGLAWVEPNVDDESFNNALSAAKGGKRGLWKDRRQMPPWRFRALRSGEQTAHSERRDSLKKQRERSTVLEYRTGDDASRGRAASNEDSDGSSDETAAEARERRRRDPNNKSGSIVEEIHNQVILGIEPGK